MTRVRALKYQFVHLIPDELEAETLYVSTDYATASHLCCCGCGTEVVTPLSPTNWRLTFDGESITLHPSIGNWSFACQSHYWIRRNGIHWAERWTPTQIAAGRDRDRRAKRAQFGDAEPLSTDDTPTSIGVVARLWSRLTRRSKP